MLPIKVEGSGLIPRGYGIAPRRTPFPADLVLISIIINTPGLEAIHVDPETKKTTKLTRENHQKVYKTYENKIKDIRDKTRMQPKVVNNQPEKDVNVKPPVTNESKVVNPPPIVPENTDTKEDEKKIIIKPVYKPDEEKKEDTKKDETSRDAENNTQKNSQPKPNDGKK